MGQASKHFEKRRALRPHCGFGRLLDSYLVTHAYVQSSRKDFKMADVHYQGNLLRPWTQLFSSVSGGIWTPHSPVLIKISEDESPLNQLPVKNLFFSLIMKTFCHKYQRIVHEKVINFSVWIKKICTLLLKLHIICSRMQKVNLHARPSIIQMGCPICCYQVCALDHVKGVLQTWIIPQSPAIIMRTLLCLPFSSHVNQIGKKV